MIRRWNNELYIRAEQAPATFDTAPALWLTGEILTRTATRDTLLIVQPGFAVPLSEYNLQFPAPIQVVTVHSRGHVVEFERRTLAAENYDRWIVTAMHNAWNESVSATPSRNSGLY